MAGTFDAFETRMREAGLSDRAVRTFQLHWERLAQGETGLLSESNILPAPSLPDSTDLDPSCRRLGEAALTRLAVIRLNGGLGTSMGLRGPKSLLPVRDGHTFLDILTRHILAIREATGVSLPLLLMNSFRTEEETLRHLERYRNLPSQGLPLSFVQHRVPKVGADSLEPVSWPREPELEWCPPGHGDLFLALDDSGVLSRLLELGYEYAFVANADNLGASISTEILGYLDREGYDFVMEAADRTAADRKGGHLARLRDGRLVLRESAQCPPSERDAFQDVERHRYFNTNNIWLRLAALKSLLDSRQGVLPLPTILNRKNIDPRDPASPRVIQLETAMGAAISFFQNTGALRVPRGRFSPVKTTDDLLAVRSDAYVLTPDSRVQLAPQRTVPPAVDLDPAVYRLVDRFDARFPDGPPSLLECRELVVRGDVTFGGAVVVRGCARIEASGPSRIAGGTMVEGRLDLS